MKRILTALLTLACALCLSACSGGEAAPSAPGSSSVSSGPEGSALEESSAEDPDAAPSSDEGGEGGANILIAYFTMPEDVDTDGVDAVAGASVVVRDGEVLGNVEYMARVIQETVGGDLFRIETVEQYPLDHDPLVDQAAAEQDEDARPQLATRIENPDQYDTILLGYPNWWGDMPQALYTFLEEYDFSGKTIIPFCPHGGSGFSRTESTIASLQPGAEVSGDGLTIPGETWPAARRKLPPGPRGSACDARKRKEGFA